LANNKNLSIMTSNTLLNLINIRGQREQAFKFAASNFKGGMKQCYTKGCEIFTPLYYSLRGVEISEALMFDRMHNGETKICTA
jgi:hypothetical protein